MNDGNLSVLAEANADKLRLSGSSKGTTTLSVTRDDGNAATNPPIFEGIVPTALEAPNYGGLGTWKTAPLGANRLELLKRLDDGTLAASSSAEGERLRIRKDTVAR